jgi:hypothetical protein
MIRLMGRPGRWLRALLVAASGAGAAVPGCATSGGGTHLPWCRAEAVGELADVDSTLAGVTVHWQAEGDEAQKVALGAVLRDCAARRGYRVGVEASPSRWVVVRREGGGPPGAGTLPWTREGYAAALADRVRRSSPRAVPPTRGTLELQVQKFGVGIWTGEVRFDPDTGSPEEDAAAALRAVVWQLPRFGAPVPTFARIPPESAAAFYRARLEDRSFACPVLPYPVRFPRLARAYLRGGSSVRWEDTVNAHDHDDPSVLPACMDLVLHADAALPHSIPGYVDLAGAEIWRDATLFGTYRDQAGEEVHVEVRVRGDTRGYDVHSTRVLDAREAAARGKAGAEFAEELARFLEGKGR